MLKTNLKFPLTEKKLSLGLFGSDQIQGKPTIYQNSIHFCHSFLTPYYTPHYTWQECKEEKKFLPSQFTNT